jgi:hypothetical protein
MVRLFALMGLASFSLFANPLCAPGRDESRSSSTTGGATPSKDPCANLTNDFSSCVKPVNASPCTLPEEFIDACVVGCMIQQCPTIANCTNVTTFNGSMLGKVPCANCADLHDGVFWEKLFDVTGACEELTIDPSMGPTAEEQKQYAQCVQMVMESKCPALTGTGWFTKIPGAAL